MAEHPIIFTGESVRAILEGRKAQTRRIIKPQPWGPVFWQRIQAMWTDTQSRWIKRCPYGVPGDRLWVRETWRAGDGWPKNQCLHYRADTDEAAGGPWRSPRFMPRWASRLLLELTEVRVQRLQEISAGDIDAEGIDYETSEDWHEGEKLQSAGSPVSPERYAYACLWNAINGKRAPWASNPFVWCLTLKVIGDKR